ncbi:TVP38/TMEM64 family protein [Anaerotignum sp. MSJ-24]|uniref:TVP38/TMEM64 family protein n=1 Tax=Anaerotignum sp. MSJ-24 TaxID=2841521 RepID=UPI00209D4B8E|nr:TVP38/TMEM64 family protein [Anaerotignum sp. MSJ-24]MBD9220409.1 TVP38/TMEM64 family protein [Clostridiales bacterium]
MNKNNNSIDLYKKILLIVCTAITVVLTVIGYKKGIFTDETQMELFLNSCGIFAPLFFVFIQAVQVIIPILPGAVGCVYGVMFWGPLKGFIFNYIGICIGSIGAFLIARRFGQRLVIQMTGEKFYDKYSKYLEMENRFEKIFALLIFLPVAPDDFLCYLAGISKMDLKKFVTIILLGKPAAIFLYSMGLNTVLQKAFSMLTQI